MQRAKHLLLFTGILAVLASIFLIALSSGKAVYPNHYVVYHNIVFGSSSAVMFTNGNSFEVDGGFSLPPVSIALASLILIGIGFVFIGISILFIKKKKAFNGMIITASIIMLAGAITSLFAPKGFAKSYMTIQPDNIAKISVPFCTIGGALGIFAAVLIFISAVLKDKEKE